MGEDDAAPLGILTPADTAWEALVQQLGLRPPWGNPTLTLPPGLWTTLGASNRPSAAVLLGLLPLDVSLVPVSPEGL